MYRAPAQEDAILRGDRRGTDQRPPNRAVACLLAAFCGIGAGHYYAGLRRRALGWLCAAGAMAVCSVLALPVLARASIFGWALPVLIGGFVLSWLGPFVDLCLVPQRHFSRVPLWQVAGYVAAAQLGSMALSYSVRTWLVEAFKMPSSSMSPTLLIGDHIFIDKSAGGEAERGQVVDFEHPEQANQDFIKRVVGMPGDVIQMKEGELSINGWPVPRCPLGPSSTPGHPPDGGETGVVALEFLDGRAYLTFSGSEADENGTWTVGAGERFVLGDFRTNSADSRTWFGGRGGGVPLANVKGAALGVWMKFDDEGAVDWSRIGVTFHEPVLPSSMRALEPALEKCLRSRPSDVETRPPGNVLR